MPLDAQTEALLAQSAENSAPLWSLSVEDARRALKEMSSVLDIRPLPVAETRDIRVATSHGGDFRLRIYWPETELRRELPVVLFLHGGGFALGDVDTHDATARYYCARVGALVVSVDYRRPPEYKFPIALEDCYAALNWVVDEAKTLGADSGRIAVAGDSAGGNLAASVCQLARNRKGPQICYEVLVYPNVNFDPKAGYPSRKLFGGGEYFLGQKDIDWLNGLYLDEPLDCLDPRVSPILAEDLSGLPDALVITAGFDPLRDEGQEYAQRLRDGGAVVDYRSFDSTIHGFLSFAGVLDAGQEGLELVATHLKRAFRSDKTDAN